MAINFPELVQNIGLEELSNIDREELAANFMPAAVTGLADGDIALLHPPYTGRQAELYGENHFGDGQVAKAIIRAAIDSGRTPGPIYDFQGFAAEYFAGHNSIFNEFTSESTVRIYPEAVTIDGNPLALARTPSLVFDYGACLTGRSYIADQIGFLSKGQQPFTYSPLTRLRFTNEALINTYDANYGRGTARAIMDKRLYIGREDGVAAATDEVIRAQSAHRAPTDIADIILCTGAEHSSAEDLKRGMMNAYTLLKEGGMLVVRTLARPASDELGTEKITSWAFDAGFQEKDAIRYEADLDQIGTLMLTGHFGEREIQTVVLRK
jgi:hypothetical protein